MSENTGGIVVWTALALSLMLGGAAIFYGRWTIQNPTKAAPVWLISDPTSPTMMRCLRAYGLLFIFVGSLMTFGGVTKLIVPESFGWDVGLFISGIATWCFRPKAEEIPSGKL